ncbi:sugar kinase [Jannaschia marina]|uniref:sugar kinase n=1 Tax=Jannaschia marina TaxID=2741674 RepID=UPI0015C86DBF|nr:sugar kinase [Jannaschia marina]
MTRRLTGVGECMVELSQAPGGLYRQGYAGDVVNTLWYARKALPDDWQVRFHTGLGIDLASRGMEEFLNAAGIETDTVLRVPARRPGLYMIHLDGAERSFSYWRDTSAARRLASDEAQLAAGLADSDVIYFSGITLGILDAEDAERLLAALDGRRRMGATVAFDPNIRPALWSDSATMRARLTRGADVADLILPSFDDETAHFGDANPEATARRYATREDQTVVVKNGAHDVLIWDGGAGRIVETPSVADPVDTTGAGDSFAGGFLAAHVTGFDVEAAVRAGQATAAHVIRHHGALV